MVSRSDIEALFKLPLKDVCQLYIDGRVTPASSLPEERFDSIDPSTRETIAVVQPATHSDIEAAVASAKEAFPHWSTTTPAARAQILQKSASIMTQYSDKLAELDSRDVGKALSETSVLDIPSSVESLEYCASFVGGGGLDGRTVRLRNSSSNPAIPSTLLYETKEPIGVCAAIGVWNYPLQTAVWKSAPCLAAGNTLVYKPSEFSPLHATALAMIYTLAGVPPGVFNVIQGDGKVGAALVSHPDIRKVSFTGQVSTGQKVAEAAGRDLKGVIAELGGKSPFIVLPDCKVENAVDGAMLANFFTTGQVCTNGTRVFVPQSMLPDFEKVLMKKLDDGSIRYGDPLDMNTNMGPLANEQQWHKVKKYVAEAVKEGKGKLLYGGGVEADAKLIASLPEKFRAGFWICPTVFTNCPDDMTVAREEVFGPLMCILPYNDQSVSEQEYLDQVIKRANNTSLGLAAGVFTENINLAHQVVARLEAGITWINTWGDSPPEMAVAGWKMSGIGVENGQRGIEEWTQSKSTLIQLGGKVETVFRPKT